MSTTSTSSRALLCPSARCKPRSLLLGVIGPDGRVQFAHDRLVVDDAFVEVARLGRRPEARFRFASPCVDACANWEGRCRVADGLAFEVPETELPACSIRGTCRWHAQRGDDVCLRCAYVVTDVETHDESKDNNGNQV